MNKFKMGEDRNVYLDTGDKTKDLMIMYYDEGAYLEAPGLGEDAENLVDEAIVWLSTSGSRRSARLIDDADRNAFCKMAKCSEYSDPSEYCTQFSGCCGYDAKMVFKILAKNGYTIISNEQLKLIRDMSGIALNKLDMMRKDLF